MVAAVVLPKRDLVPRVHAVGSTFVFSGPLHPAELGAAIVSADIHLSAEQQERAERLRKQIVHIQNRMVELQLPVASLASTPIWFVWTGGLTEAVQLVQRLMDDGFYANTSAFPAVPIGKGGVRFTNTLYHSIDQIDALLDSLARHAPGLVSTDEVDLRQPIAGD